MPAAANGLPRYRRVCEREVFARRRNAPFRFRCAGFVAFASPSASNRPAHDGEPPRKSARLGVVVSRRFGKAVERNRFKRRVRELFRTRQAVLPPGIDLVIVASGQAGGTTFTALNAAFDTMTTRLGRAPIARPGDRRAADIVRRGP